MSENVSDICNIEYFMGKWIAHAEKSDKLDELADFYSNHYGVWGENEQNLKGRIKLSSKKLKGWLDNEMAELWTARREGFLVGYAIVLRGKSFSKEKVIWVTQFVIHEEYRNIGIGKYLLFNIWGFSSYFAWGLLTANPYAIRALEKATHRRCDPKRIKRSSVQLFNFGKENICYLNERTVREINEKGSKINTEFFVDHSGLDEMLESATSQEKPWLLGRLEEGWEWFAFTFKDQHPIELTSNEIDSILAVSDKIAKEAYSRMPMDDVSHLWASYTEKEVDYILRECEISQGGLILDVGCGMGRHSIALSKKGYNVEGIDYSKSLIQNAKSKAEKESVDVLFKVHDIVESGYPEYGKFDCVLCLYDVIGSYADNSKNKKILKEISLLLKSGGKAIISVMNLQHTEYYAKNRFNLRTSSKGLLNLQSSNTMEKSGNVFNPDYYLLDEETKVVYRKEEFSVGDSYPIELVVRDRRFYMSEIVEMCEEQNLKVKIKRFVKAGWDADYDCVDKNAKEILIICEKE